MRNVSKQEVRKLIGKSIYAVKQDGSVVTGKLVRIHQNKLVMAPLKRDKGKQVQTKAFILPLVLFDLLAIGTIGGGFGGGCCNNNYNNNNNYGYGAPNGPYGANGAYGPSGPVGPYGYGNQGYNGF